MIFGWELKKGIMQMMRKDFHLWRSAAALATIILLMGSGTFMPFACAASVTNSSSVPKPEMVGNKFCSVSGDRINEKNKVTYEYKGKVYNFCSPDCVEEFKKDPEKYLEKMEKAYKGADGLKVSSH